jgi:hypothetical protein
MDFYSQGCNVLLLKFTGDVALDEGGLPIPVSILGKVGTFIYEFLYLSSTSVANKHKLEGGDARCRGFCHSVVCR